MEKILVTGGAGYIGSHMVAALCEGGYDVCILDNFSTSNPKCVERLRALTGKDIPLYCEDIRNVERVKEILIGERIEAVIHFAAYSLVGESVANPLKYYENNLNGTCKLLQAIVDCKVKYVIFSSTAATYGEPEHVPVTEEERTLPTNPYGETKLAMERMFAWAARANGPKYVALRYFNACGAHESGEIGEAHNPETHLIPNILAAAAGRRTLTLYGDDYPTRDGTCVRDYVHVTDLARAHIAALEYLAQGGESDVFNIGTERGFTVKEILDAAQKVTGKKIDAVYGARRAGDPAVLTASYRKAKEKLGWEPKAGIEQIIASARKWHAAHPDGY